MIGLNQLHETIETVRKYSNKELRISGILMIKYSPRTNLNVAIADGLLQMADRMHTKVFNSKIRETVKIKRRRASKYHCLTGILNVLQFQTTKTL